MTIHSVEEADGVHFLTMELVEGQSLDCLIAEGSLPVEKLVEIATALADALAAAHDKGIVHRDLKPANVMVGEGGRVKVLDFGLEDVGPVGRDTPPAVTELRADLPRDLARVIRRCLEKVPQRLGHRDRLLARVPGQRQPAGGSKMVPTWRHPWPR